MPFQGQCNLFYWIGRGISATLSCASRRRDGTHNLPLCKLLQRRYEQKARGRSAANQKSASLYIMQSYATHPARRSDARIGVGAVGASQSAAITATSPPPPTHAVVNAVVPAAPRGSQKRKQNPKPEAQLKKRQKTGSTGLRRGRGVCQQWNTVNYVDNDHP